MILYKAKKLFKLPLEGYLSSGNVQFTFSSWNGIVLLINRFILFNRLYFFGQKGKRDMECLIEAIQRVGERRPQDEHHGHQCDESRDNDGEVQAVVVIDQ